MFSCFRSLRVLTTLLLLLCFVRRTYPTFPLIPFLFRPITTAAATALSLLRVSEPIRHLCPHPQPAVAADPGRFHEDLLHAPEAR